MLNKEIKVLDKGFVALEGHCADDLSVVNSARVSFNKRVEEVSDTDDKLIGFLLKNRHGTPFEANFMRFRVKAPIFVFREWHRHRIGISINEWSARYSQLEPDFYIPDIENVRVQVGKAGHYKYLQAPPEMASEFIKRLSVKCQRDYEDYEWALHCGHEFSLSDILDEPVEGIAKEQARFFLNVNIYSEMYWSCNARSLMSFLSLRNSPKAQWEIKEFAVVLEDIFKNIMPITHKYFIENDRMSP